MDGTTEKRILRLLNDAYNNTPYFNNVINGMIDDDSDLTLDLFSRMPIFNKQTIKETGWPNFVSGRYLDENYRPVAEREVRLEHTSGTTGDPMQILWNRDDYFSSIMNHWKYREQFGITPCSKYCSSSKRIPGGGLYYIKGNNLIFSIRELTFETIPKIIEAINNFKPEWIFLQNSILYVLVYAAKKLGLHFPDSIKYIEFMGEPICGYYRKIIENMISAPTSNMYGCVETNCISYECKYGHNHLVTDNVYAEIVDLDGSVKNDGEDGYVCVTGLHNTGMPIIRYRLNDLAKINRDIHCPCGNPNPTIQIKAARMPEFLILNDINVYDKAHIYCPINAGMDIFEVRQSDIYFNLKMNTLDHYEILVYQNGRTGFNVEKILHDAFAAYGLPNIKFTVMMTEEFDASQPAGIIRLW